MPLQISISNAIGASGGFKLNKMLFDEVPANQLFGFSYRRLRKGYLGNCLQVRRSSDNTVLDVGFVDDYLDLNAISAFCGSSQGYLTQWYNQSIIANNLRQVNAVSQPMIYDGSNFTYTLSQQGFLVLCPRFDGIDDNLQFNFPILNASNYSHFSVFDLDSTTYNIGFGSVISDNGGTGDIFHYATGYNWHNGAYQLLIPKSSSTDTLHAIGYVHDSAALTVTGYQDSVQYSTYFGGSVTLNIRGVNSSWAGGFMGSNFAEIVGYSDNKNTSTSIKIQNNQSAFYQSGIDNFRVLDAFPSAEAAFSLTKLRTNYSGSALRVRRSSDNTEQDIGFLSDGTLDVTSLLSFCGSSDGRVTTWYNQSSVLAGDNFVQANAVQQFRIVVGGVYLGALKNTNTFASRMTNTIEYASGGGVRMTDFIHHRIIGGTESIAGACGNTFSLYYAMGIQGGTSPSHSLLVSPQFFKNGTINSSLNTDGVLYNEFVNNFAVYGMTAETSFYFRTMGMGYPGYDNNETKTRIMFKSQDLGVDGVKGISNQIINFT